MNLPEDVWIIIVNFMRFKHLLIFQIANRQCQKLVMDRIKQIEIYAKICFVSINIPHHCIVHGSPLFKMNSFLYWGTIPYFNHYVSDNQPRDANRGLGFTDNKWIWIRGPFINESKIGHDKETYICIFQEDHIYNLTQYLKKYEIEMISKSIDKMNGLPEEKSKESCIIS
jgi:hypothetical protein